MSFTADPSIVGSSISGMSQQAQIAYYMAKLQGDSDMLAFQKAQAALAQAGNLASAYGYAPGGNWYTFGPGGPTQPTAGTPTLNAQQVWQQIQNQLQQNALAQSGVTGYYAQPMASQYAAGTVLTANNGQGGGNAYGVVNADGSVQMVSNEALSQLAGQRGTTQQAMMQGAQPVDWNTLQSLSQGPPTGPRQMTQQAQAQQYAQAAQSAGLTGMFSDPTQTADYLLQQGKAMNGQSFDSLPQDQQQYWLQYNQNNPTAAAQQWARSTNSALQQAGYANTQSGPQATMALQQMYGTYGAPTAGQQTLANIAQQNQIAQAWSQQYGYVPQFDANGQPIFQTGAGGQTLAAQQQHWQQGFQEQQLQQQTAQNYLQLMSSLRGPADWAQYQKVLGATPGGMKDLVAAAAGQYVPGAGGTTGVQPQSVSLSGFINQSTGQGGQGDMTAQQAAGALVAPNQMAPQTWNALNPSQKQNLLGLWESQGYTQQDAQNLFNQSLPRYGTSTPQVGSFKLQ